MSCLRSVLILCAAFLALYPSSYAGSTPAPGSGIAVPLQSWTQVLTPWTAEPSNDWEHLVCVPAIQQSVMLSQYHQTDGEPNESLIGYNSDTNSWDVLDISIRKLTFSSQRFHIRAVV
jgi:hypothetical protein